MTTLAQFRTAISAELGLDNSTSGDQPSIDRWVNEAVTEIVNRSQCRIRCATMTLTPGTWKYTIDANILNVVKASLSTSTGSYPLEMVALDDVIDMQTASSVQVSPAQYYAVAGADFLVLYPTPASADTLNLFYAPVPATLSMSSDTPSEIPDNYHNLVEFYAEARASTFSDDASSQEGNLYRQMYEQGLKRMKRDIAFTGGHRLPTADINTSRRRLPYHDRSRYPAV